jgi:hypothetical protein
VRRKGIALAGLVVTLAVVLAVAIAARSGGSSQQPSFRPPDASKQYGDDADLMRRLERKKLTTRDTK